MKCFILLASTVNFLILYSCTLNPYLFDYTSTLGWIWKTSEQTFSVFLIYKDSNLLLMLKAK